MRRIIDGMRVDVDLLNREDVISSLRPLLSLPERTPELDFFDVTVGGLRKCIVLDLPHTMHYVTSGRLEQWELSPAEAFEIADRNLAAGSSHLEIETAELWPGQPLLIGFHDGYDAARITVKECRQQIAKELGPWFWVALPARDYLLACSSNINRRTHRAFCRHIESVFETLPYPLSPEVFAVSADEFPFTPPKHTAWWRRILG
jgi:hypothetical protein